jgi:hypothetical protein
VIIYYQKRKLKYQVILGIVLLVLGIAIAMVKATSLIYYIWILFGLLQISCWYYKNKYQYMVIEKNTITKNSLFPRSLKLSELKTMGKFKGSFSLKVTKESLGLTKI